jgi:hypothetical protein
VKRDSSCFLVSSFGWGFSSPDSNEESKGQNLLVIYVPEKWDCKTSIV